MARQTELPCPSGLRVKLRSIKGKDISLMQDRRALATGEAMSELLNACTIEVIDRSIYEKLPKFDWADVLIGDRLHALIGLRIATNGASYEFETRCIDKNCNARIDWTVNLDELDRKDMSEASRTVFLAGNEYVTTCDDKEVTFKLLNGRDQARYRKVIDQMKQKRHSKEKPLIALLSQIKKVEGVTDISDWLDEVELGEITRLRKAMEQVDCGVETTIGIICPACDLQQEMELPLGSNFFGGAG